MIGRIAVKTNGERGRVPNQDCSNLTKRSSTMDVFKTREHNKVGMESVKHSTKPTKWNQSCSTTRPTIVNVFKRILDTKVGFDNKNVDESSVQIHSSFKNLTGASSGAQATREITDTAVGNNIKDLTGKQANKSSIEYGDKDDDNAVDTTVEPKDYDPDNVLVMGDQMELKTEGMIRFLSFNPNGIRPT